jgi:hypothetical protein
MDTQSHFTSTGKLRKRGKEEKGSRIFLTLEKEVGDIMKAVFYATAKKKSMSMKVKARIGWLTWETSVFPTKDGQCFLPIKKSVRKDLGLKDGDEITVWLEWL